MKNGDYGFVFTPLSISPIFLLKYYNRHVVVVFFGNADDADLADFHGFFCFIFELNSVNQLNPCHPRSHPIISIFTTPQHEHAPLLNA